MKKLSIATLIFAATAIYAQTITGTVKSKEDETVIPYAKIGISNEGVGVQTDANGKFEFNFDSVSKDKQLLVEVGGFEPFKVDVSDFIKENPNSIYLTPKSTNIEEVSIKANTYKEKNLGVNTKSKNVMYTPNMEKGQSVVQETAVEFSSKKKIKISKININFARFESTMPINIRYTIYDEKDGKPGNLILNKDILATIKPTDVVDQTYSIDVNKESIWLEGKFFIGIQFIGQSDGKVALSGALFRTGYYRSFYDAWGKIGFAAPAINIDVKIKK